MNTLKFEPKDCARARGLLDSFLDGELLVETNYEILKHIERCAACSADLEARARKAGVDLYPVRTDDDLVRSLLRVSELRRRRRR